MKGKKLLISATCFVFILVLVLHVGNIPKFGTNAVQSWRKLLRNAREDSQRKRLKSIRDVTFVTAYFNLGDFRKGTENRRPGDYLQWMRGYRRLRLPVVMYTDDADVLHEFSLVRKRLADLTECRLVDRKSLRSFRLEPQIRAIFRQPQYPLHYPNTVLPAYSCAMHAKYELLAAAMRANPFGSEYFAWADFGGFRQVDERGPLLNFEFPPGFDDSSVAVAEIAPMVRGVPPRLVIELNMVSVGGTFLLGRADVLGKFVESYRRQVQALLAANLMSTDQQVIYVMYSNASDGGVVPLKTYSGAERHCEPWFHLMLLVVNHPCEPSNLPD